MRSAVMRQCSSRYVNFATKSFTDCLTVMASMRRFVSLGPSFTWKYNQYSMWQETSVLGCERCIVESGAKDIYCRKFSSISQVYNEDQLTGHLGADLVELCGVPSDTRIEQKVLLVHLEDARFRKSSEDLALYEKTEKYKLDEARALVESVVTWKVVSEISYPVQLDHLSKDFVLHRRNLADLNLVLSGRKDISVVFINVPQITSLQFANLLKLWNRYVLDRYMMVLTIFRLQASSKEAKLQVARLMISLIKHRIEQNHIVPEFLGKALGNTKKMWGPQKTAKGAVTRKEHRRLQVQAIDSKVKEELEVLRRERQKKRKRKELSNIPIISVIGYTNCGKTTLVKSLTSSDKLKPWDKLFATTEVSTHHGELKHGWNCMYNDTVGFISQMPHQLVEAFVASFEDILRGHLIVNVTDISHPDWMNQLRVVHETIQSITENNDSDSQNSGKEWGFQNLKPEQRLVQVFNKSDKLGESEKQICLENYERIIADYDIVCSHPIFTIATSGFGNEQLVNRVYDELLLTGVYSEQTFLLPSYDSEYEFLQQFSWVISEEFCTEMASNYSENVTNVNPNGCIRMKVVIHDVAMRQFVTYFPRNATGEKYRQKFMAKDDFCQF